MLTYRATGTSGAINEAISFMLHGKLHEIRLHLNAAGGGGDLTVTIDSAGGSQYDTVILKQDMTEVQDLHFRPNKPIHIDAGSALKVAWANTGNKTYGLEVLYEMGARIEPGYKREGNRQGRGTGFVRRHHIRYRHERYNNKAGGHH